MCCLEDGLLPCMENLVSLLSICRKKQDMPFFHRIHSLICIYGLETNAFAGDYLVPMLVECGNVSKAQQMFYKLLSPNEACWISLMEGYARQGQIQHSVDLFNRIEVYASSATFHAALKAFSRLNIARGGQEIHIHITNKALENDLHIGSSLVDMYVKCGWFTEAENVLKMLPVRNVVSWTALMVGYAEYGYVKEVLNCMEKMRLDSVSPNAFTFVCILKVFCNQRNFMDKARSVHSDIVRHGFETNPFIGSALVGTYARCSLILEGLFVFDELLVRDLVSWNSLLLLYAEHGLSDSTILCIGQMQEEGISPDGSTYVYGLKCCGNVGAVIKGRLLHFAVLQGGLENDAFINSTLVDMYVRCGCLVEAWNLVDDLSMHSCTALIGGYVDQGYPEEALEVYEKMQQRGMVMDSVTYACSLRACTSVKALGIGQKIHAQVLKSGLERESCVGNVLVDMYAKCGLIHEAQDVFDNLSMRNEASWSSLITGYANQNLDERVLACLEKMKSDDIVWDAVIAVCCLRACANIGVIDRGFQIHADMAQDGLDNDILVGNTLVDMYAKCGLISEARVVFDELSIRNVVSWTAIIAGYACQGKSELVFHMFEKMQEENVQPDGIALLIVLTVCRYGGHVDKGRKYFEALSNKSSPLLTIDHYNCMLDLTSSSGRFSEALEILDKMPFQPNMVTWNLMLSACRKWGNILLARNIFECALRSDVLHDATFLLMSNIFADAQMVEDVKKTELLRRNANCLEQKDCVNLFFTRDCKHIQVRDFYPKV